MIRDFVLIIGAMKSGTSSLFYYLAQHPEIAACIKKEPDFFGLNSQWDKGWGWYESLWPQGVRQGQLALEASTSYTKYGCHSRVGNPAQRMQSVDANFKFIYLLRNPLERIESHYDHGVDQGWIKHPLTQLLAERDNNLVGISKYATQLAQYSARFSANQIKLVAFEDLKHNPNETLRDLCEFLAIDADFTFTAKAHNGREERKYWSYLHRLKDQYPWLQALSRYLPKSARQQLMTLMTRQARAQQTKLTVAQRELLLGELQADLNQLQRAYGFDIQRWGLVR